MSATATIDPGSRLRRARELSGMRERSAAKSLGVRRSQLRAWESGADTPDTDELARLVDLYSADLAQVWPDRQPLLSATEPGVLIVGDERVELFLEPGAPVDNRTVLQRYLAAVRRQRGETSDARVDLRAADIDSLATVLNLADADLENQLADLLDLTPAGARFTARAMMVGGLSALAATTLVAGSWFAAPTAAGASQQRDTAAATAPALFSPEHLVPLPDADIVDAELVGAGSGDGAAVDAQGQSESPFSTEPTRQAVGVELAPAVFAVAPANEWQPVLDDGSGDAASALPAADLA